MWKISLSIIFLFFSSATAIAQPIIVRSGEHISFTRISFSNASLEEAKFERDNDIISISFTGEAREFDTSSSTRRLNANRVIDLFEKDAVIHIALNCDCNFEAKQYSGNVFAVDIFDTSQAEPFGVSRTQQQAKRTTLDLESALDRQSIAAIANDFVNRVIGSAAASGNTDHLVHDNRPQIDSAVDQMADIALQIPIVQDVSRYVTRGILTANSATQRSNKGTQNPEQSARGVATFPARSPDREPAPGTDETQFFRRGEIPTFSQTGLCKTLKENAAANAFSPAMSYAGLAEALGADQVIQIDSVLKAVGEFLSRRMDEEAQHLVGWWLQSKDSDTLLQQLIAFLGIGDPQAEAELTSSNCTELLAAVKYIIRMGSNTYGDFQQRADQNILRPLEVQRQIFVALQREDTADSWKFQKQISISSEHVFDLYNSLASIIDEAENLPIETLEANLSTLNEGLKKSGLNSTDSIPLIKSLTWQMRDTTGIDNLSNLTVLALLEHGRLEEVLTSRADILEANSRNSDLLFHFLKTLSFVESDARFLNLIFLIMRHNDGEILSKLPEEVLDRLRYLGFSDLDKLETEMLLTLSQSKTEKLPNEGLEAEDTTISSEMVPNQSHSKLLSRLRALKQNRTKDFQLDLNQVEHEISNSQELIEIWNEI